MKKNVAVVSVPAVHEALRVILSDEKHFATSLNYAVNYASAGLGMTGHELGVQCLYILNNMGHWRHARAKEVRETLRAFAKQN